MADQLITGTTLIEDKRDPAGGVLSIPGCAFIMEIDNKSYTYAGGGIVKDGDIYVEDAGQLLAPIILPHGAEVTGAVVYGAQAVDLWYLYRKNLSDGTNTEMASAIVNTEDTSISNEKIDNTLYSYFIITEDLENGDMIHGARITYK